MNIITILRSAQDVINSRTILTISVSNAVPSKKSTLTSLMLALSLLFSLLRVESGWGQTLVTIGTGTLNSTGTNGTPIYRSSTTSSFHHSKSIQLVTAAQLSASAIPSGSSIAQWGYNKSSAGIPSGSNAFTLRVYLKNVTNTALASGTSWDNLISGATLAYTATINSTNMPSASGFWMWPTSGFIYSGGAIMCCVEWFPAGTMTSPFSTAGFSWVYGTSSSVQAIGTSSSATILGTNATWSTQSFFYDTRIGYSAPAPCSGIPNAGTSSISSSSGCSNVSVNLSASGLSFGTGISYQWQSSIDNGVTWNNILGATNSTASVTPSVTTMYRIRTTCSNSASSNNSSTITYTVNVSGACLCGAYPLTYASNTADEEISNVTVGSMNNTSTCSVAASGAGSVLSLYSNYSGVVTGPSVMQGSSVNFSLTQNSCGGVYGNIFQLYVDWNQDGDWLDAGEQVHNQGTTVSGNQTVSGSFTVPVGATVGTTRMRVVNIETTPTATNYAHTGYLYGETEDYCFTVNAISVCSGTPVVGQTAAWSPSAVTGFNADVIANGVGAASLSATQFDLGGYGLVSADFQAVAGNAAPIYSLPLNGIVNSATNAGINYQMANYSSSNSLRLITGSTTGSLTLSSGSTAKRISVLTSSGSGSSSFTAQVNFSDLTNQQFTGNSVSDWYGSAYAIAPIGRILLSTNVVDGTTTSPGLYDVILTLSAGNQSKTITSIQFTKTDANASALNILGLSLQNNNPSSVVCNGQSRTLSLPDLNSAVLGLTYQWQTSSLLAGPWSNISSATSTSYTTPALTTAGLVYYRCNVTCTNSASAASSTPIALTVNPSFGISPASGAVCSGSSLQASPSSNSTYLWSNNATTSSISVTSAGTYSVLMSNNGCVSKPSATVTLLSAPTVTSTGSLNAVCTSSSSQSSTFSYSASTNSPTSYSIDWNAAANTAGIVDVSTTSHTFPAGGGSFSVPIAANVLPGVYVGVLSFTNAIGCVGTLSVNITITGIPTLTGVAQMANLCYNPASGSTNVSIQLSGLLNSSSQTATYNMNGGTSQTIAFTSSASGTATLAIPVTMANHGQTLTITGINCANFTTNNSCVLTIIQAPTAPTVSPATLTVNVGASATTTASLNNSSNSLRWWNAATAGNQLDADVTTPGLDDAVFNSYQAQVSPPVPNPTPTPNVAFCTPTTNYTYYVEEFDAVSGCSSTRTPMVVTTNPLFSNTPSNLLICQAGGSVTLQANITPLSSQSFQWLSSTTGTPTTNAAGSSTSSIYLANPSATTNFALSTNLTPFGCSTPLNTSQMFAVGVLNAFNFTPTANPSSVCINGTTSLTSNVSIGNFSAECITSNPMQVPPVGVTPSVLCSGGTATVTNTGGLDDGYWNGRSIGFNYNFFGSISSTFNIGTNGTINFGTTGTPNYSFPSGFPSTASPLFTIAACARDLQLGTGGGGLGFGTGTIRHWTEGIPPTRRCVIQYIDCATWYSTNTNDGKSTIEVILYETTGIVDIKVITATNPVATTGTFINDTRNKYIGLQGNGNPGTGATAPNCLVGNTTAQANYWNGIQNEITAAAPKAWRFTPGANYSYQWYLGSNTSAPITAATSATYTTTTGQSATAGQKTYTVGATNPLTGCASTQPVQITVNALPAAPISSGNVTACNNAATTTLTSTAPTGCVVDWYSNANGTGLLLSGSSSYSFVPTANTYYAYSRNSTTGCSSATGTAIVLTVVTAPATLTPPTPAPYCQGDPAAPLTTTGVTGSNPLNWYLGSLSATPSTIAPTPVTSAAGTTSYLVTQTSTSNGCASTPATISIVVNATPNAPAYSSTYTTGTITQCQGTAPISIANAVVASSNGTLYYYMAPTGGTALSSTPSSTPSIAGITTYYVSQVISGCEGPRTVVTSIVNPSLTASVAISASSTTVCPGGLISYNAVPTNGGTAPTYAWFVNASQVGTGSTYSQATPVSGDAIYATMVSNEPSCLFTPNATSATITLNNSSVSPSVSIIQNTSTTICANSSVTFSVANALNMGATPTYAWQVNGTTVGTAATHTTTTLTNNDVVSLTITSSLPSTCLIGGIAAANAAGITMTVTPVTAITAQPANASVCLGGAQSLAVSAIGTGTITYQWQSAATTVGPFSNISFASNTSSQSATLSIPSVAGQLSYQLVATSSCGNATSSVATISINQATGITAQPQAVVACDGTTATFNVTAIGTGTISYQWRFNGTPIAGAISASYSIPAVTLANAGQYSVVVSATCGSVTSANAQLTVNPLTTISSQPVSASICDSTSLSLSVVASGTAPISYQWRLNGTPISGATSALYTDPTAVVAESGLYTVLVSGGCSNSTSSAATVVVSPNTWITAQPVSYTGCALNPTSLSVTGLGANLQYQWSIGSNPATPITGATSSTYSLSNPQTSNSGSYTVTMTGTCGMQTSNIALVTINPVPSAGTISGGNSGVCVGSTINLTNLASGGVWTSSNPAMGSISSTGVLTGVSAGTITVTYTVTNSFGCVSTATKVIQVKGLPTAVIQTPLATSICQGEAMNLQSSAAVSYAWSNGATSQNSAVNSSATGTANYSVTVTGTNACTATSAPLAITVIPVPTIAAISGSGNFPNFCLGNTSNLSSATPNGLWSSSNTNILTINPLSGAANTLTIGTATVSYYVANIPGCLNPNPGTATASVTISTPPAAFITSSGSTTFCQGGSITLTAPTGVGYNYLWSNGATTQTITVSTSGSYSLTVTATGGCSVTSLPTTVNVLPIPSATIFPTGAINICSGTNVTLSTGSSVSYVWSNGAITPTISVNAAGNYSVTLTGTNGCTVTSAVSTVTVTPVPSAVITANGPTNICDGGSVGLSVPSAGSYLWSNGATTQGISATSTGNYSVTATNGICSTTSTPVYVNFNPVPSSTVTASGPTTFCQGGNVTLAAATGNSFTYLWSNGATTQSITVAASGTYSVTVSNSFNCSSTSTPISVVVNTLPTASITAAGSTTICSGNSLSLTAASANAYLWSTGATTQSINASTSGNYTVQAISAAGCTATSSVVALNVLPSPTAVITQASGTTFCQGGSVVINSTPASSYLWSNNEITQAVSVTTSGIYSVLVTAANGCTATSNTISVNVLPIPTATIFPGTTVNVCAGSTVTLSTGTAASYTWSNGANTPTITIGTNSTHTVTLVGSNGCTATSALTTVTVNPIPVAAITASGTTNICSGTSVNLTATSAGSYLWSNGATTQTIAANLAGAYTVTVTTAGCSATSASTTVNVNQSPTATVTASGPTSFCQGGSVSFTANAGNGFSYLWSNGATTATISVSTSGNNNVTVTNLIGCSTTSAVNAVVVNPIPVATITAGGSTTICSGSTVSLSAPAGANYLWNTGSTSQSINAATVGNYTVVVTSAAGCSATSSPTTISVNALPSAAISSTGSTTFCQGGTVGLSANSGMTSYLWSNGGTGQSIAAGNSGAYTVVVTDANGCSATSNLINVNVNPAPTATIFPGTNVTICSGSSVTLSTNSAISYNWSTGAITPTIQVNTPGTYSVSLTGSNGCSATSPLTIVAVTTTPTAAITSSGPTTICQGANVSLSAPAAANSYLWNTGSTTQTITVSLVGSYFVTVGSNGCSATSPNTFVSYNPVPSAAVSASGPTTFCQGNNVSFSAPAGNGNIYLWNTGATTQTVNTASAGNFSVTVTNGYGCSATSTINAVLVNPLPVVTAITGSSSICAGTQGQVSNVMSGGVYASSNLGTASIGQLSGQITGLTAGTTTISYLYTNNNGCSNTVTYPVTVIAAPVATVTAVGPTTFCQGGSVVLSASSGTAYAWSNGATTASITVSSSGSYSVSVTGSNGCSASSQATLVNVLTPSPVNAINGANAVCVNSATSYTNTTSGGSWSSSNPLIASVSTAGNVTGVSAGSATITYAINSTNGCQNAATKVVTVNAVPATALTSSGSTTFCQGGNVSLAASTGSTYLWSTGATTSSITASSSGTYNVTVTNANGCSSVSTNQLVTVNANPTAAISTNGSTNLCTGGSIVLMATPSASYLWNTGATTSSITATTAGSYSVTVTNTNGCFATSTATSVVVNASPSATVTAGGPTSICSGNSVVLTAATGTGNTYQWTNNGALISGATSNVYSANASGSYAFIVTNASGCTATSVATPVSVVLASVSNITASGSTSLCNNASVTLTATSGASYLWSNGATTQAITVNTAANYTVTVTNVSGCTATSVATPVIVNASPAATITAGGPTTFCQGGNVVLTASAGATYVWSNGATTSTITAATPGTYSVLITNASGCSATSTGSIITVNAAPNAAITAGGSTTFCSGGSVTLSASAGASYLWSTGATTASISVNTAGATTVTVTNAAGCLSTSTSTTIVVNATPTASITAGGSTTICSGSSVTLTASAGSSYVWNNGSTTSNIVANTSGNYTVTVFNANGCSAISTPTTVTVNNPSVANIATSGSTNFCTGGSVVLTATAASTYAWSTGAITQAITVSASGNYSVTLTNASGCTSTSPVTVVTANALPSATITAGGATTFCQGGSVNLTASAATSYVWSNGATTASVNITTPGSYTVQISNSTGCTATSTATLVTVNALPTATITAGGSLNICAGSSVALTASAGSTYLWSTGATTPSITVNTAGSRTVTVTNPAGCSSTSSPTNIVVNALPTPSITSIGSTTLCQGATVTLTTANGTGLTYQWQNNGANIGGTNAASYIANTAGSYTVQVTNAAGCSGTSTASTVVVNALPVASISNSGSNTICAGTSVNLTASGGTVYAWSNGAATASIAVNATGNYTVSITNAAGCSSSASTAITMVTPTVASISANGPTSFCAGQNVVLTANAGTTYLWSTGATTASITVSTTSNPTVQVTYASGCSSTSVIMPITVNALPAASITANGATSFCPGATVTLTASAGSSYSWTNGATTNSIVISASGSYGVSVTNASGCVATAVPTAITVFAIPTASISTSGATTFCQGSTLNLTANAGASYVWSSGATTSSISTGVSGNYSVTVFNANGCPAVSAIVPVTLNANPVATIQANGPTTVCQGSTVVLTSNGGTGFTWSNLETTASISVSTSGSYGVTVTNAAGCSSVVTPVSITVNPVQVLDPITGANSVCVGATTTYANTTSGGTWTSNNTAVATVISTSGNVSGVSAGTATIKYQFVNAFGCTSEVTNVVTVNGIQPVSIVASGSTSFCQGGSVTLTAPTGLNYNWTNGQTTQSITVNASGTFALAASNAAGCFTTSSTVVVTVNPAPVVNITSTSTTLCQGSNLVLNAPANAASYTWSNGSTTQTILINTPGTYALILTDANGCSAATNTTIVNGINPVVSISAGGATTFCQGGNVVLNAAGGTSFLWNNGATTQNISVSTPGNYSVMVTNAAGCSSMSNSTIVNVLQAPVAVVTAYGSTTFCQGGSVTIATSGGTSYAWSNGSTSQSILPTTSGSYSVITTGANGCTATSNAINVTVNPTPTAVISPSGATTFCEGSSVNLVASGGATYAWNNGSTNSTLAATTGGVYTVTVTNAGGCTDTETMTVTVNEVPSDFIVTSGSTTFCQGGEVSLTAQAGNTYVWSNNATTQSIAVTTAGTYSVSIVSPNGCSVTSNAITVDVNQPSASNLIATAFDSYTLNEILYTQSGTYTQTLTNAAGCDSTITLDLTLTVGIEEGTITDVNVYPNPTSESFTVKTSIPVYGSYNVVDAQGKLVFQGEMTGTETHVNISSVARGIYYLRIPELSEPLSVVKN